MEEAHVFLEALATVLCVAAVTTVLFQKLKQPVVLGYILAGFVIGPHVSIPLVADPGTIHTLSELGIVLLMFSLGLEFSLRKLFKVGPSALVTAVVQCSLMMWLGFALGRAFGWTTIESLFAGAVVAISSTTIIAKAFEEQGVKGRLRELVIGVLIVEDLIAILLMASLTALGHGGGLSAWALAAVSAKLAGFLVALVVVGLLVIPRTIRMIDAIGRPETTLVASVGICFGIALLAQKLGYSVALGAFIAGSLIAESGREEGIEKLVMPVRDLFAAIFFVSVGMMLDPKTVTEHWRAILAFTGIVVAGKVLGVSLGAFLTGNGTRTSIKAGMSLAQIGEFSFIIAGLGLQQKSTGPFLYPIAIAVSAITTLLTPWLIRAAGPFARAVDHAMPAPLQTFATLYGSWLERLGTHSGEPTHGTRLRRLVRMLVLDALVLGAIIVATALFHTHVGEIVAERLSISEEVAHDGVVVVAVLLALPFFAGLIRVSRKFGTALAELVFPGVASGAVDLAAAPRRALVVTLQLAGFLLVGTPLVALTQPLLPGFQGAELLLAMIVVLGVGFWKSAMNLEGHVRAGAQVIVEALATQASSADPHANPTPAPLGELFGGLGTPETIPIGDGSPAVGHSLAELDLRGVTGATVLAITGHDKEARVPGPRDVLHVGDILAVAGSREAIEAARALLLGDPAYAT